VRDALSALTLRGRCFLAAGGTALVGALVLGHAELVRVAALLILLPLVGAAVLVRSRYRLGLVRSLSPTQVASGQQARVQLELSNDGRMPTGVLLLEDQVPYVLGTRPRFVIDRMSTGWRRTVDYSVRSDVRGRHEVGPMHVQLTDPFGLVQLERTFRTTSTLTVTPRIVPLPVVPLSGVWTGSGDNRPRAFASGSAEDVTVREYRRGDDLRRVHWRSSAHAGELMVRREEQPWQSRATLFLDNRTFAHRGRGAASSFEHAVVVAASVAVHLVQRGFSVRLITAGESTRGTWHEHGDHEAEAAPLLESLAVVSASDDTRIDTRWLGELGRAGLVVAVLGDVEERDLPSLRRIRHEAASAMAFVLDVPAWAGQDTGVLSTARHTAWLGAHGWRAVAAGPQDALPLLWQELALPTRSVTTTPGSLADAGFPEATS
jgi:uncharacterized protein (DUF58 family)